MRTLTVNLEDRSYPIYIGAGISLKDELYSKHINANKIALITNEEIADLYLSEISQTLTLFDLKVLVLPEGESEKNLETVQKAVEFLSDNEIDRKASIIALGGGVVGDITGFVASSYMRGINFLQVPTTLLAQVDSSVGGKTGVNTKKGKNLIGAFYQPSAVIADTRFLKTLEPQRFSEGLAEVIKYGLIRDLDFFEWLEVNTSKILALEPKVMTHLIERCCQIKAEIVSEDEREGSVRAILNFGHTFGHAIESLTDYSVYSHGEAVAMGMVMASNMSHKMDMLSSEDKKRITNLIKSMNLPTNKPDLDKNDFFESMRRDKKTQDGQIRLILLESIGRAMIASDYPKELLMKTILES
jgi:3-dehydroquinate synthase|tara:strand:- start:703 stop:1773 length:1071 start_codon:yes stop_codon:yes gene_type:complete